MTVSSSLHPAAQHAGVELHGTRRTRAARTFVTFDSQQRRGRLVVLHQGNLCLSQQREDRLGPRRRRSRSASPSRQVRYSNGTSHRALVHEHRERSPHQRRLRRHELTRRTHARRTRSSGYDPIYATELRHPGRPSSPARRSNWANWYQNASPGPKHPCTTAGVPFAPWPGTATVAPYSTQQDILGTYPTAASRRTQNLTPARTTRCQTATGRTLVERRHQDVDGQGVMLHRRQRGSHERRRQQVQRQATIYLSGR